MIRLAVVAGLVAMLTGPAPAAGEEPEKRPPLHSWPVRALAVTLDAQASRRFAGWLESYAAAQDFKVWKQRYDRKSLVFTLTNNDIVIGGENTFDAQRFAIRFFRYAGRTDPDAEAIMALAGAFAQSAAKDIEGATVSPSYTVWEPPDGVFFWVRKFDITLKEGARDPFLNRLRAFARKYEYVVMAGSYDSHSSDMVFTMLGKTVRIDGASVLDPLKFTIFFFRNGPPDSSTDEDIERIAGEFSALIGKVKGVEVSGNIKQR